MRNINCIYCSDHDMCQHPDQKKLFFFFKPSCMLFVYNSRNCKLQEGYYRPPPPPPPPPRNITGRPLTEGRVRHSVKERNDNNEHPLVPPPSPKKKCTCENCGCNEK